MRQEIVRVRCDSCGTQRDCTLEELLRNRDGEKRNVSVPEGWFSLYAEISNEWGKSIGISEGREQQTIACSKACAVNCLEQFAAKNR